MIDRKPLCGWTEDDEGHWATACGHLFEFIADGPDENSFKFCPFCGRQIDAVEVSDERP